MTVPIFVLVMANCIGAPASLSHDGVERLNVTGTAAELEPGVPGGDLRENNGFASHIYEVPYPRHRYYNALSETTNPNTLGPRHDTMRWRSSITSKQLISTNKIPLTVYYTNIDHFLLR